MQRPADETNPSPEPTTHGVGPWIGEWPEDARYDRELLESGDTRNVVDAYRYWSMEAIVADLDARRHPFHVAIENWQHDMNIGSSWGGVAGTSAGRWSRIVTST